MRAVTRHELLEIGEKTYRPQVAAFSVTIVLHPIAAVTMKDAANRRIDARRLYLLAARSWAALTSSSALLTLSIARFTSCCLIREESATCSSCLITYCLEISRTLAFTAFVISSFPSSACRALADTPCGAHSL